MSLKTIVVYLSEPGRAHVLMEVAMALAEEHEAHLVGLHIIPDIRVYGSIAVELAGEILDRQRDMMRENAEELGKIFSEATSSIRSTVEWRCDDEDYPNLASEVSRQARCGDLVIAGQPTGEPNALSNDLPARLVFGTGRPVLIVPSAGTFRQIGRNVLVGWNDTREAARAAFDAIPLMKKAENTRILSVNPHKTRDRNAFSPGDALALALARHGIPTESAASVTSEISPGDELLSRAADYGSDLLVMGCYGHSRLRETIFGGVTRKILETMTIPVLMSH